MSPAPPRPLVAIIAIVAVVLVAGWLLFGGGREPIAKGPPPGPSDAGVGTHLPTPAPGAGAGSPGSAAPPPTASSQPTPGRRSAVIPGSVDRASLDLSATYDVDLDIRWADRRVGVDSSMRITNASGGPIDRLELNTVAARLGGLTVTAATVDGIPVEPRIDDQTLLVPLDGVLPDGASMELRLAFSSTLRSNIAGHSWLFGRGDDVASLYRWLPWISRRVPFDRPNIGDPFVTPVSPRVEVTVATDRPLVIATSGRRVRDDGLTQVFVGQQVRDFAILASPSYRVLSRQVGDTTVRVYHLPDGPGEELLRSAERALERMSALVGPYPYAELAVGESVGGHAIESPGLVWIPSGSARRNLDYLVHHEVAHQWFYGLVGADQASEPFTDEAITELLARHVLGIERASRCGIAPLDRSIYEYSSACYYEIVYVQGANLLDEIRRQLGDETFWGAIRGWIEDWRHQVATARSLLDSLDDATPSDLRSRLRPRFPSLY